ncbi:phosphotransferase enzyme family protein [Anatilimnocola floriformis]|uniref:phosphotransferase enzyme family protein n=1 Tax=Anatilimnocola floriformis TaxID=2948575 RepID=UPI0020C430BE|nr:phosphotransferase [Anatilimnocola floriformis]
MSSDTVFPVVGPAEAETVLQQFADCCARFQLQSVAHQGFSGARIWKVVASDPRFLAPLCLKRWPDDHPPPARLPWIHQVLLQARERGISFVPQPYFTRGGQSSCEWNSATWELMTWLPGEVETAPQPSPQRITAAFRALAAFHQATADVHQSSGNANQPAPAIADRLARWRDLTGGGSEQIQQACQRRSIPALDDLAALWLARHAKLPVSLTSRLFDAAKLTLPLQPAIRDLWRDHVLFDGDNVAGFIDFGAMRIDTPLTDIARLLGSLAGDDPALRQIAIDTYSAANPLSAADRDVIDLLDHTGAILAGWNWLEWLYVDGRQFPSLPAVRERFTTLVGRTIGPPGVVISADA